MEAPTSPIPSEFYIQYLEHICIVFIINKYKILGYFSCVDSTVIPRLTKIIRSGITFVSRNVMLSGVSLLAVLNVNNPVGLVVSPM